MTPSALLREGEKILGSSGVARPRWTAEQLLARRLECEPLCLYLEPPPLRPQEELRFRADLAARAGGMPLQYLLGEAAFYGREFLVGPGVFIPRPETELLIEEALGFITPSTIVVEVGTGSGAIAVTLALERPARSVVAIERSSTALGFARRNAARHRAGLAFVQGDLAGPLRPASADLMVANLPYLEPERAAGWPKELRWEPWMALDGGPGGLSVVRRLLPQAAAVLRPGGRLILEIGAGQAQRACRLARPHRLAPERVVQDLAGLERVVVLWKN